MSIKSTILIPSLFGKWTNYASNKDEADQPKNTIKDVLHVPVEPIIRSKAKVLKETLNEFYRFQLRLI